MVKIEKLSIAGAYLIESDTFLDSRGSVTISYHGEELSILPQFVQDNVTVSKAGVFRGFHTQLVNPQGKLVRCISGEIIDYFIDLDPLSPTFKSSERVHLSSPSQAVYIPPTCGHAFYSYKDSIVVYKCTTFHDNNSQSGFKYNARRLSIPPLEDCIVSEKDLALPSLEEFLEKRNK